MAVPAGYGVDPVQLHEQAVIRKARGVPFVVSYWDACRQCEASDCRMLATRDFVDDTFVIQLPPGWSEGRERVTSGQRLRIPPVVDEGITSAAAVNLAAIEETEIQIADGEKSLPPPPPHDPQCGLVPSRADRALDRTPVQAAHDEQVSTACMHACMHAACCCCCHRCQDAAAAA